MGSKLVRGMCVGPVFGRQLVVVGNASVPRLCLPDGGTSHRAQAPLTSYPARPSAHVVNEMAMINLHREYIGGH